MKISGFGVFCVIMTATSVILCIIWCVCNAIENRPVTETVVQSGFSMEDMEASYMSGFRNSYMDEPNLKKVGDDCIVWLDSPWSDNSPTTHVDEDCTEEQLE